MNVVVVGGSTHAMPATQPDWKLCGQCNTILPTTMFRMETRKNGTARLHSWCRPCLAKYSATSSRKQNRWCRRHPDTERGRRWRENRARYRNSPQGKAMRRREHERVMADPEMRAVHRARVRACTNTFNAIQRLLRDLSGAALPRPWCSNNCQTHNYDSGKRERALHRKKWCSTCSVITNDAVCMCCWTKTRNLFNLAAHKRRQWEIAEGVELTVMLGGLLRVVA